VKCGEPEAGHIAPAAGPFATERQARDAARQVYDAFAADPGPGKMAAPNLALLTDAVNVAGVRLGEYDRRILDWLAASWEPTTCVVIAGLITRAADQAPARQVLDEAITAYGESLSGETGEGR
jgi:hypothetical protein